MYTVRRKFTAIRILLVSLLTYFLTEFQLNDIVRWSATPARRRVHGGEEREAWRTATSQARSA